MLQLIGVYSSRYRNTCGSAWCKWRKICAIHGSMAIYATIQLMTNSRIFWDNWDRYAIAELLDKWEEYTFATLRKHLHWMKPGENQLLSVVWESDTHILSFWSCRSTPVAADAPGWRGMVVSFPGFYGLGFRAHSISGSLYSTVSKCCNSTTIISHQKILGSFPTHLSQ